MMTKVIRVSFLIGIFLFSLLPAKISVGQDDWWDDAWSFRQEIVLGSLTSEEFTAYQPVDISIRFDSSCWAINETKHSVRVICQNKNGPLELESQLYDLEFSDETHITLCNLVFLIPSETDGTERYYIYYDESSTSSPDYFDHVSIKDSSYFYEPIPGYPLESHYYQISQHDSIRYIVAQEGKFLWYTTTQYVTKLKEGSIDVAPKSGEAIASFEFVYYYAEEMWQYSSTSQELITAEILCDGNLMVSCKIISRSTDGDLRTTAVYKYFYCPISLERIHVHVIHEALKECQVYEGTNTDGTYASLQCGGMNSVSIADLNFGKIYPYFHFYSEQDTVEEYLVNLHPESTQNNPVLWLLQTLDDVDLGKDAWVSFDDGTAGAVHALIFGSSSVVKLGENERDGIQLTAYESNYPHIPGLDYTFAAIECNRNAFEKNISGKDTVIPQGFIAEFDAEFFSSPIGGTSIVEQEAKIFQTLIPMKPSANNDDSSEDNKTTKHFSLSVSVHNAPSFPLGSLISAITGRHFPYITIEIYRDNTVVSAGTAGRLPILESPSSEKSSFTDTLITAIHMIDFRNLSLFKKFTFQQLEIGRYAIKVFKENPLLNNQRCLIGYEVIDLTKDSSIHVFCQPQGSCGVTLVDQQGNGISDALVMFLQKDCVVAQNKTDTNGVALLKAPCNRKEPYQMIILDHGFEVANESIRLRYSHILFPLRKSFEVEQYNWMITLLDLWGLPLDIDVIPRLTSIEMQTPTLILAKKRNNNCFQFTQLIPTTYNLEIQYKSFSLEKEIRIPSTDETLEFPALYPVSFHVFDSRGVAINEVAIQASRGGKTKEIKGNGSVIIFPLPPGLYFITAITQGEVIGKRSLTVMNERNVDLITNQEPIYPLIIILFAGILVLVGLALTLIKKEILYILLCVIVGILIISLFLPWWSLQGFSSDTEFSSTLFLIPLNLVSRTITPQVITGEIVSFPEIFTSIMIMIPVITGIIFFLCVLIAFLKLIDKRQWFVLLFICALILIVISLASFVSAMSAFTDVGVGSFIGEGTLDVSIPGEEVVIPILCHWGPGLGFWLYILSCLVVTCTVIFMFYKNKKRTN